MAKEDNGIFVGDRDGGGGECYITASVAQLAHGDERGGSKSGNNVDVACIRREEREIKLGFMGRDHKGAVGGLDGDWRLGEAQIEDGSGNGAEVGGTAGVGNGDGGGG
jgi:hypothetical protein